MQGQNGLVAKYTFSFINTVEELGARYIAQQCLEILFQIHVERDNFKVFIVYGPFVLD